MAEVCSAAIHSLQPSTESLVFIRRNKINRHVTIHPIHDSIQLIISGLQFDFPTVLNKKLNASLHVIGIQQAHYHFFIYPVLGQWLTGLPHLLLTAQCLSVLSLPLTGPVWEYRQAHAMGHRLPGALCKVCEGKAGDRAKLCKTVAVSILTITQRQHVAHTRLSMH